MRRIGYLFLLCTLIGWDLPALAAPCTVADSWNFFNNISGNTKCTVKNNNKLQKKIDFDFGANEEFVIKLSGPLVLGEWGGVDSLALNTDAPNDAWLVFEAADNFFGQCALTIRQPNTTFNRVMLRGFSEDALCIDAPHVVVIDGAYQDNGGFGVIDMIDGVDAQLIHNRFINNDAGGISTDGPYGLIFSKLYFQGPSIGNLFQATDSAAGATKPPQEIQVFHADKGFLLQAKNAEDVEMFEVYGLQAKGPGQPYDELNRISPDNWKCSWESGVISCHIIPGLKNRTVVLTVTTATGSSRFSAPVTLKPDAPCPAGQTLNGTTCVPIALSDVDSDAVPDTTDNCPATSNALQGDLDQDGKGDACDTDDDDDGIVDAKDNCPGTMNAGQKDVNKDGMGDDCNPPAPPPATSCEGRTMRTDGSCPCLAGEIYNPSTNQCLAKVDSDSDGIIDAADKCSSQADPTNACREPPAATTPTPAVNTTPSNRFDGGCSLTRDATTQFPAAGFALLMATTLLLAGYRTRRQP